jgi:hypothetical protein
VASQVKKWFSQEMAEGYDNENEAKGDKSIAQAQTQDDKGSGNKLDERNGNADDPERPDRQEGIGVRKEIFPGVLDRSQLKHFPETGHEKNQAKN